MTIDPGKRPTPHRRHAWLRTLTCTALAGIALVASLTHAADLVDVRVGVNNLISDAPFFIADKKGYFKEQGIRVTLVPFDAGPKMIAPLGTGQLEAAAGAVSAGLFNAVARGIDIKVVADKGSSPPMYDYMPILVRKSLFDSGTVKGYADLKGRKVAEAAKGGSPGSKLNEALKSVNLGYNDVEHEYIGYPQHVVAFSNGAIDASVTAEPSATQAIERGVAVRLSTDALYPNQQIAVLLYGGDFIKKSPEVARKFMVAYIKAARFFNDALKDGHFAGPNAAELIAILTADSKVKDAALYKKMTPNGVNPDGKLNEASLAKDLQFFRDQGYIEGKVTLDQVVDTSFADAAVKQLGEYHPKK